MPERMDEVERALRDAVTEMPYCSISVKLLCERAGITRKAFYKRFGGKGDVLRAIIERDVVSPEVELIELLTFEKMRGRVDKIEEHMFRSVRNDGEFYRALVAAPQGGRGAFMMATVDAFHDFCLLMLEKYRFEGEPWQRECVASFYANAKARVMLDWIEGGFEVPVVDVSRFYSRMALPFWRSLA